MITDTEVINIPCTEILLADFGENIAWYIVIGVAAVAKIAM